MQTSFNLQLAKKYKSPSQKIKILSESWVADEIFCPSCGKHISKYENNRPVADFHCDYCREEYELKSKKDVFGSKIVNGAYDTMIERLKSSNNPNFFLLNYNIKNSNVINFYVVPKHFFVPDIIEIRKPLSSKAERAGWVGCNIIIKNIPQNGKIFYIKNGKIESKNNIIQSWQKTLFLREEKRIENRGWILEIMKCIEALQKKEFSLQDMYTYEPVLKRKYPANQHIKDKIRQQLQFLRDKGYLEFTGKGNYKLS